MFVPLHWITNQLFETLFATPVILEDTSAMATSTAKVLPSSQFYDNWDYNGKRERFETFYEYSQHISSICSMPKLSRSAIPSLQDSIGPVFELTASRWQPRHRTRTTFQAPALPPRVLSTLFEP